MPEAVIVSTARSPIGRAFKGSLKDIRADDLTVQMVLAALGKPTGDLGVTPRGFERIKKGFSPAGRPRRRPREEKKHNSPPPPSCGGLRSGPGVRFAPGALPKAVWLGLGRALV